MVKSVFVLVGTCPDEATARSDDRILKDLHAAVQAPAGSMHDR